MNNTFKLSLAAVLVSTAMTANAGISIVDNEEGNFSVGGNVELNFNFEDRESNANDDSEFNQDGRVLIEFAGEKYTSNGHYVGVKAQPLFESTGNIALDDAYFEFGKKDGWAIKAGRFEAYDMFPVGLDVFLEYSGDTANDLYADGAAYSYQMKEARGRGSDGQIMYNQTFGNLYVEVGAMLGDRSDLFKDLGDNQGRRYHGKEITEVKDSFLVRPVVAYQMGDFTVAASMETNLVSDAIVAGDIDVSDRTGYGLTGNWTSGDWSVNTSVAYLDAVDENNMSVGANALWNNLGLGYIYSSNEYQSKDWAEGDVNVSTWYASYAFRDVLEVQDFSILLGTYYTMVDNKLTQQSDATAFAEEDDFGARVRLYYEF
ncbi:glycoporin [Vibrio owensii]|uniref:carbohydrate porin n=1 Tax=Vibrio owensii TaxID=696485 RepID=UPI0003A7B273|nr:carbohydrate porin [Vibrio owensii]CAH1537967.1 Putative glycoporin [Vibrio owensii]CAH1588632.1 Putative glycoporin [Vibrio owensii]SUP41494.1 glycoporin [Vibrio owensii]